MDPSGLTDTWQVPVNLGDVQDLMGVEKLLASVSVSPIVRTSVSTEQTVFTANNNTFKVVGSGGVQTVTIPIGTYYTLDQLVSVLNTLLLAMPIGPAAAPLTLAVTANSNSGITIQQSGTAYPYQLDFEETNSAATTLGYDPEVFGPWTTEALPSSTLAPLGYANPATPGPLKVEVSQLPQDGYDTELKGPSRTVAYMEAAYTDTVQFPRTMTYVQGNVPYGPFTVNRSALNAAYWTVRVSDVNFFKGPMVVALGAGYEVSITLAY